MGLKELKPINRIFFLQFFTAELIKNMAKEKELKKRIEAEKIKIKYIQPPEDIKLNNIGNSVIFHQDPEKLEKSITSEEPIKEEITPHIHRVKLPKRITNPSTSLTKTPSYLNLNKPSSNKELMQKSRKIQSHGSQTISKPPPINQPLPTTPDYALKKIEPLIKDNAVQMIECPGPGKHILVKARNKINSTKIILNESEIKNIINYFSVSAKIPIIGGILKAAVNNLVISAIVSEYVGSRFIINKKSPYALIEGMNV
jgi:hypothetical protein